MSPLRFRSGLAALALGAGLAATSSAQTPADPELAVRALFQQRCADCHSPAGDDENPTLSSETDLAKLRTDATYIAVGSPENSPLFQRVTLPAGDKHRMPKSSAADPRPPLSPAELEVLKAWIAPAGASARPFIEEEDVITLVQEDLRAAGNSARFYRYLTLHNLANAGDTDDELETYRAALSKLINSLSWEKRITRPVPIDPKRLVYRLDLRAYGWNEAKWDRLVGGYPYALVQGLQAENEIRALSGTAVAMLRGDWFTFAASQPPLYEELLDLPGTDAELERSLLHVDVAANWRNGSAARAGFVKSGVSASNRMVERHPTRYGAYWKSYDFKANENKQDLLRNPLGPAALSRRFAFAHDGGEMIWNLPNGLQAYLLATDKGNRIARGPTEIVRDPSRADVAILNGISCMSCHAQGMRVAPKGNLVDEIRTASEVLDLAPDEAALVRRLYPAPASFEALYTADAARFRDAQIAAGVFDPKAADAAKRERNDPVSILYNRFKQPITLSTAPSEFGVSRVDLQSKLRKSSVEALRSFGQRLQTAGSFERKGFVQQFRRTVRGLRLGELRAFQPIAHADFFPDGKVPDDFDEEDPDRAKTQPDNAQPEPAEILADSAREPLLAAGRGKFQQFTALGAFRGQAGIAGRAGARGNPGQDGRNGVHYARVYSERHGKPGTPGGAGGNGEPGGPGGEAAALFVRVSEVRFQTLPSLARITITRLDGTALGETYWDLKDSIILDARGGDGGAGGNGGDGGKGGDGGYGGDGGGDLKPYYGGEGGNGAVGGNGGNGANGGNGGDGARVRIRPEGSAGFLALVRAKLRVDVSGGDAGRGGAPGAGGAGGVGAEDPNSTASPYHRGGKGQSMVGGSPGQAGTPGQPGAKGSGLMNTGRSNQP